MADSLPSLPHETHFMTIADGEALLERVIRTRKDEQSRMEATMNKRISELNATISEKREFLSDIVRVDFESKESYNAQMRKNEEQIIKMNLCTMELTDTFRKDLEAIHRQLLEVLNRSRALPTELFEKDLQDFIKSHRVRYQS